MMFSQWYSLIIWEGYFWLHFSQLTRWNITCHWLSKMQDSVQRVPLTCIWSSTPVESIRLATFTAFPHISYWGFRAPITPATTGPMLIPGANNHTAWAHYPLVRPQILLCILFTICVNPSIIKVLLPSEKICHPWNSSRISWHSQYTLKFIAGIWFLFVSVPYNVYCTWSWNQTSIKFLKHGWTYKNV
jgi:hypothetical protein